MSKTPSPEPAAPSTPAIEDADDFASLCPYCHLRTPIYTCPACLARTCSVACSKRHKLLRQCNGVRDPTAYVKRSKLMTPAGVDRDYNYLTSLDRQIFGSQAGGERRGGGPDGDTGPSRTQTKSALDRERELERRVRDAGVSWKRAPWKGFQRAKENQTAMVSSTRGGRRICWTVEWLLLPPSSAAESAPQRFLDPRITETRPIFECFFHPVENGPVRFAASAPSSDYPSLARWTKAEMSRARFYLSLPGPGEKKRCVRLDSKLSWHEELKGRTVMEFPTVVVWRGPEGTSNGETETREAGQTLPGGWDIVDAPRKIQVLPDNRAHSQEAGVNGSAVNPAPERPHDDIRNILARRLAEADRKAREEREALEKKLAARTVTGIERAAEHKPTDTPAMEPMKPAESAPGKRKLEEVESEEAQS